MIRMSLTRFCGGAFTVIILLGNFAESVPVGPMKRAASTEVDSSVNSGFSSVPKVLEIQLPLKIVSKEDLVAWAKYVMGLMASRINITLSTVRQTQTTQSETVNNSESWTTVSPLFQKNPQSGALRPTEEKLLDRNTKTVELPGLNFSRIRQVDSDGKNQQMTKFPQYVAQHNSIYPSGGPENQGVTTFPKSQGQFNSLYPSAVARNHGITAFSGQQGQFNSLYPGNGARNREIVTQQRSQGQFLPEYPTGASRNEGISNLARQQGQHNSMYQAGRIENRENMLTLLSQNHGHKNQDLGSLTHGQGQFQIFNRNEGPRNQDFRTFPQSPNEIHSYYPTGGVLNQQVDHRIHPQGNIFPATGLKDSEALKFSSQYNSLNSTGGYKDVGSSKLMKVFDEHSSTEKNSHDRKQTDILQNQKLLTLAIPANVLPLPLKISDGYRDKEILSKYFYDSTEKDGSGNFQENLQRPTTTRRTLIFGENKQDPSPFTINDVTVQRNLTDMSKPILTLPFNAIITITRQESVDANKGKRKETTEKKEYDDYFVLPTRDPPDEFPPYFEKNYTTINQNNNSGATIVAAQTKQEVKKGQMRKSKKRQTSVLSELLTALGLRKKNGSKNITDVKPSPPVTKILKGSTPHKIQVAFDDEPARGRERRNETANQEIEEEEPDEESAKQENDDDDDDDEVDDDPPSSLQAIIDVIPLIMPVLEDLSDPNSDADLAEIINVGIPLLEGLSEGDEDTPPVDIPGTLVPVLTRLLAGQGGQGVDSGAVLPPLISVIAPLIGPLIGPLVGPIIRAISSPGQGGSDFSALVQAIAAPLSTPTGPYKMSPLSNIVAGVVSSLSKELLSGKGGSDLGALVAAVVSGTLAGSSAGVTGASKGGYHYNDHAPSPTSYGGYGGEAVPAYGVNPVQLIGTSVKEILGSGLQVATSLVNAVTGILGASSQGKPSYGPPPSYGSPANYGPSSTRAPYSAAIRPPPPPPQRQTRVQKQKFL